MALEVDPVILELRAELRQYNERLAWATAKTEAQMARIEKATLGAERSVVRSSGGMVSAMKRIAAAAAIYFSGREMIGLIDTGKRIEAQLKVATTESGNFGQAQEDVRAIAARTRSELEAVAKLYGRIILNSRELGVTQEQAAQATETFTKALKIGGASTAEAASATTQFAQALASGVLRGDELRSILESSPRFAKLLSDSLGTTVGNLRKMGEAGELTADKLINALTNREYTSKLDEEFKQLSVTFSDAMQQVENAAVITFGAFDKGGQFSEAITSFMMDGVEGFQDMEGAAEEFGATVRAELDGIMSLMSMLQSSIAGVVGFLREVDTETGGILSRLQKDSWVFNLTNPAGLATHAIRNNPVSAKARARSEAAAADRAQQEKLLALSGHNSHQDFLNDIINPSSRSGPRGAVASSGGGGSKKKGGSGRSAAAAASKAERERVGAIRDAAAKYREELRLDEEILAAKASMAVVLEDIAAFKLQQIDSEERQRLADITMDQEIGDLTKEEADRRRGLVKQLTELEKIKVNQRLEEENYLKDAREMADEADTLQVESQLNMVRKDRLATDLKILELQHAEEDARLRAATASMDIADAVAARARMDRRHEAQRQLLEKSYQSPLEGYFQGLRDEAGNLGDAYEDIAVNGLRRMEDGFRNVAKEALGLHGILGDVIADFIELAFRQTLLNAFGGGGGGGGIFGSIVGAIAGIGGGGGNVISGNVPSFGNAAGGGPVRAGKFYRVNEGAHGSGRVEGFVPDQDGRIIPLGQMNQAIGTGGRETGSAVVRLELSGDIDARIQRVSGPVAVEVVRAAAPTIVDAASKSTFAQSRRPNL